MADPDPRGLIRESYAIEGIGAAECRSIFLDWALELGQDDIPAAAAALIERHDRPGHPMTALLEAASGPASGPPARRRRR